MADVRMFLFQAKSKYRWNLPSCKTVALYTLVIFCTISVGKSDTKCGPKAIPCIHGQCLNTTSGAGGSARCVCDDGWKGQSCDYCSGRAR